MFAKLSTMLGKVVKIGNTKYDLPASMDWVGSLNDTISLFMVPLFVAVAAAGTVYAVILGVNLARAESAEKREEAKKRLIWAIVGIVSIVVLILLLELFMANLDKIIDIDPKYKVTD